MDINICPAALLLNSALLLALVSTALAAPAPEPAPELAPRQKCIRMSIPFPISLNI